MKLYSFLLSSAVMFNTALLAQEPTFGNGSGGGGSGIKDGDDWEVGDLRFTPTPAEGFTFAPELVEALQEVRTAVEYYYGTQVWNKSGSTPLPFEAVPLWSDFTGTTSVQYSVVTALPENCRFMPTVNLKLKPNEKATPIACTFGKSTYLLKDYVEYATNKKKFKDLALLLVHERLIGLTNNQVSYDVLTNYISGLASLTFKVYPAQKAFTAEALKNCSQLVACNFPKLDSELVQQPKQILTAEEAGKLNRFALSHRQIFDTPATRSDYLQFSVYGGRYASIDLANDTVIGIGSLVTSTKISGMNVKIVGATVRDSHLTGTGTTITGPGSNGHEHSELRVTGTNAVLANSESKYLTISGNDVNVVSSRIDLATTMALYDLNISGNNVTVRSSDIFPQQGHAWTPKFKAVESLVRNSLKADHGVITDKFVSLVSNQFETLFGREPCKSMLVEGETLRKGEQLCTAAEGTGKGRALIQANDGNFVVYGYHNQPTFNTETSTGEYLTLTRTCDLQLFDKNNHMIWHSNTRKTMGYLGKIKGPCYMTISLGGDLEIHQQYDYGNDRIGGSRVLIWKNGTATTE